MAKATSKKKEIAGDKVEQPVEQQFVPEEGGVYRFSKQGSGYVHLYIYLEGVLYPTSSYGDIVEDSSKIKSPDYVWSYVGNLKDYRPAPRREGNFDVSSKIVIDEEYTGCMYGTWYKEGAVSKEYKVRQAFEKFFKTVPDLVIPVAEPEKEKESWLSRLFS